MRIRTKSRLNTGFAILSNVLILAIAAWSVLMWSGADRDASFANDLQSKLANLNVLTSELAIHQTPRVWHQLERQQTDLTELLAERSLIAGRQSVLLTELKRRNGALNALLSRLLPAFREGGGIDGGDEAVRLIFASLIGQSAAMYSRASQIQQVALAATSRARQQISYALAAAFLLAVASSALLHFRLIPSLVNPILRLQAEIEEIAKGNLEHAVVSDAKDEIGDVVRTFDQMRRNLLRAHQTQAEANAELAAANAELESFAYSVSHDLRSPLRSMAGFAEALKEDYGDRLDEQAQDYVARISAASARMGRLIDDLLKLSRVTRAPFEWSTVDLSNMARKLVARLRESAPERQVEVDIAPGLTARCDERMMQHALQNLLENAWKFSARTPRPTIAFGVEDRDGERTFYVRDNGVGFDMAYVDKLFKPFQRLHSEADFEGTGIGLATVARVIARHGGRVEAHSEPGEGTTIYFVV